GLSVSFGEEAPGSAYLAGVKVAILFQNPNDYDVTARVQRHWVSANGMTDLDVGSDVLIPLPKRMAEPKGIGREVHFPLAFEPHGEFKGTIDYQIWASIPFAYGVAACD